MGHITHRNSPPQWPATVGLVFFAIIAAATVYDLVQHIKGRKTS